MEAELRCACFCTGKSASFSTSGLPVHVWIFLRMRLILLSCNLPFILAR